MAFAVPIIPVYTGGGHNRECYRGCAGSVTRDADSGSRGAESCSVNADNGISGNGGLTMVFYRVTRNI